MISLKELKLYVVLCLGEYIAIAPRRALVLKIRNTSTDLISDPFMFRSFFERNTTTVNVNMLSVHCGCWNTKV
jgi:hypothetical protein